MGEGEGDGAGVFSTLLSLDAPRLRAGGLGLGEGEELLSLLSVESVPPPKLFAFLNFIVTVSVGGSGEGGSASTSDKSVVLLLRSTGPSGKHTNKIVQQLVTLIAFLR